MPPVCKKDQPAPAPPYEWKPGMPVEIPLKAKYRVRPIARRNKSDYGGHGGKKRNHRPLTKEEKALHAAQPYKIMVMRNGKCRMETHNELRPKH